MEIIKTLKHYILKLSELEYENDDWNELWRLTEEIYIFYQINVPKLIKNPKQNHNKINNISIRLTKEERKDIFNLCKRNSISDIRRDVSDLES